MTTTPNQPQEPEHTPEPPDDASQARSEAHDALRNIGDKRQADEVGETAYSAAPPPFPPFPPFPPLPPFPDPVQDPVQDAMPETSEQPQPPNAPGSPFAQPGAPYAQPGQPQQSPYTAQPPQNQVPYAGAQYGGAQYGAGQYGGAQYGGGTGQYPAAPPPPYGYGQPIGQQPYGYPGDAVPAGMPPLAGWWERVWAWLLDNFFVGLVFGVIAGATSSRALEIVGGIAAVVWSVYNAILAGRTGQSFGKRTAGIRLARLADGQPVGGGYGFLRWFLDMLFWWLCLVPGLLNYLWPLWDRLSQTWCDKIAKSVVVKAR